MSSRFYSGLFALVLAAALGFLLWRDAAAPETAGRETGGLAAENMQPSVPEPEVADGVELASTSRGLALESGSIALSEPTDQKIGENLVYPKLHVFAADGLLGEVRAREAGPFHLNRLETVEIHIDIPEAWRTASVRAHAPDGGLVNGTGAPVDLFPSPDGRTLRLHFTLGGHGGRYPLELEFYHESLSLEFRVDYPDVHGEAGPVRRFSPPPRNPASN